jgi:hypothetical protein
MDLIIIAAKLAGGDEHNIEPGFKKLAELKDRVVTLGRKPESDCRTLPHRLAGHGRVVRACVFPQTDSRS